MTFSALDSSLLGPLFATDAMRAVFSDEARVAAMLHVEAALARAQASHDLAPAALGPALDSLDPAALDIAAMGRATEIAGVPVIPFLKAVGAALPTALEPALHKYATTQDIADTATVLLARQAFDLIEADLGAIRLALASLARAHRDTPCVGRTYGQHAAPVTFGYKVAVWASGIAEVADDLPHVRARLLVASLGGPVGILTGAGDHAGAMGTAFAAGLGLGSTAITWHTRRARVAAAGFFVALLLGALAKFAGDVAHLASTEVAEVQEPYVPGRGGSSAMPHKRNPVSATVILAAFTAAKGHAATLLDAMPAAHERPAGAWHAEWHSLPQLFGLASGALREARALATGLVVHPARMRANLDLTHGMLFADAAAARLAPSLGAHAAHALVERAASVVREGGGSLATVLAGLPETRGIDLTPAFDLRPAIAAGARATDRALAALAGDPTA